MKAYTSKQAEVKKVQVGDNTFYLQPFSAFKTVHLTGELSALVGPVLSALAPFMSSEKPLDSSIGEAIPSISQAFSTLSGDKVERLMKKLLTDNKNIAVDIEGQDDPEILTESLANELFCCEVQDMFVLAFHVIQLNFSGFFKKAGSPSGKAFENIQSRWTNMVSSTAAGSPN